MRAKLYFPVYSLRSSVVRTPQRPVFNSHPFLESIVFHCCVYISRTSFITSVTSKTESVPFGDDVEI